MSRRFPQIAEQRARRLKRPDANHPLVEKPDKGSSLHRRDGGPAKVIGLVGGQPDNRVGDVIRFADAPVWDQL
jgi:hypothetical protein